MISYCVPMCGKEPDESKCPRDIDQLKKAAAKRSDKLPDADKSTKRDPRCDSTYEEVAADDSKQIISRAFISMLRI